MAHAFPSCSPRRTAVKQSISQAARSSAPEAAPIAPSVRSWIKSSCNAEPLSEATVLELARRVQRWKSHPEGPEQAPPRVKRQGPFWMPLAEVYAQEDAFFEDHLQIIQHLLTRP